MRRAFATLCLAAAAATGIALAPGTLSPNADTTWGAPTPDPQTDGTPVLPGSDGPVITPFDTTWG